MCLEEILRIHNSSLCIPTFLRKKYGSRLNYKAIQEIAYSMLNDDPDNMGDIIDACISLTWKRCSAGPVWDIETMSMSL